MGYEIERKFLVNGDFKSHAFSRSAIKQGYLSISAVSVIRVRTRDEKAWLTIKSAQVEGLIKRHEWGMRSLWPRRKRCCSYVRMA